jgi:hypothetical protein
MQTEGYVSEIVCDPVVKCEEVKHRGAETQRRKMIVEPKYVRS